MPELYRAPCNQGTAFNKASDEQQQSSYCVLRRDNDAI
jgi:hypothetical protein